jgi:hypothetical protein
MKVSGQLHAPAALSPGKSPWYPFYRLGGSQCRSGRGGEEENSQPLPGLDPPIIQPVAQRCTAELSQHVERKADIDIGRVRSFLVLYLHFQLLLL